MVDTKPFFYAVADNEGQPIMDEVCCAESARELAECFQDQIEDLTAKIVPVYTGPQIEAMREQVDALAGLLRRQLRAWRGLEKMPYRTKPESEAALRSLAKSQADGIDKALAAFDAARGGK